MYAEPTMPKHVGDAVRDHRFDEGFGWRHALHACMFFHVEFSLVGARYARGAAPSGCVNGFSGSLAFTSS